ncbi:MAG: S-adenosylmethionine:tRNA ribosyltransferase-isomerase [Cyclobacteriaceae bacterium]|nr:S-adenosylmethionine:tRNA ribosyltransferase-isomerase [Cyclobacteriaceae bacterium]
MEKTIDINEYKYELPPERIALFPLPQRDRSKLLVYKQGVITHSQFIDLDQFLPVDSMLIFNNTKVIPARLLFKKETGAEIEVFLLNPVSPSPLVSVAMEAHGSCEWHVAVGNAKRWNEEVLTKRAGNHQLTATFIDRKKSIVHFEWPDQLSFAEMISHMGATPLPPYLKREVEASDKERYQTIYSKKEGAVAAPTAGLHFTDRVFEKLRQKNITTDFLTLHVSAGTFQTVKTKNALDHTMHAEQMVVSKANLENLINQKNIVAVGTTSLRTLESIYWYGVKLVGEPDAIFQIAQDEPYQENNRTKTIARREAFENVLDKMTRDGETQLAGETSIYIVPGYQIKTVDALITNFHQPGSTLMLLVATFVGNDWKKNYQQALENDYRFLSYGDSSLLIP